ncbi:hypothetical protein cauri_1148 [Corynebacterium aurimucosum ATCC 700975]|uniref:Uncharacterized protein n=2 Tax=Corynebacterium aurimucosum TaxID=169292 RepID=C3PFY7_CORA7|nr:hypothetical protein cauri_1148 [Corynebacterium aurimucosum ATCC 700975]
MVNVRLFVTDFEGMIMKTIYKTNQWKGYGKQNYYWNEYRLDGDTVHKIKCNRFKYFDGDESVWETEEKEVESWAKDDPDMPDWLHKYL